MHCRRGRWRETRRCLLDLRGSRVARAVLPSRALGGRCERRYVLLTRKGCGIGHCGVTVGRLLASGCGHEPHLLQSVTDARRCSKSVARRGARGGDATGVWALSVSDSVSASASSRGDDRRLRLARAAGSHTVLVSNSAGRGRGGEGGRLARARVNASARCWSNSSLAVNGPGCAASPTLTPAQGLRRRLVAGLYRRAAAVE